MSDCSAMLGQMRLNDRRNTQNLITKGYSIDGVPCRGAIHTLERSFYGSNFSPFKGKRRAKNGSSKEIGEIFHKHVYHKYMCKKVVCQCPPFVPTGRKKTPPKCKCKPVCQCERRFGKKTKALKKNASVIRGLLASFAKFLEETSLFVYDCEVIVGCPGIRVATSIDVLCVDNLQRPTKVFVIELKTGYTTQLQTVRTVTGTGPYMTGVAGKSISNCIYNHHQLQLWFGVEALRRTHGIQAAGGFVVYVNKGKRLKYYAAEAWWFKSKKMYAQMYVQLERSCL